jgi:CelD/BcsL family acetyltransferase involved in cellulose biosynthesis
MRLYEINPETDPRWSLLIESHPCASIFHTGQWLEALRRTYGYDATVFTTSPPGNPLANGVVFCRLNSWLTGSRLVSVPFSDHCEPLAQNAEDITRLISAVCENGSGKVKHLEIRPRRSDLASQSLFHLERRHYLHVLDLRPSLDEIYLRFHKNCVRRKIRRADREGVTLERGKSESMLQDFYRLLLLTRRRHGLPPQPAAWFRNILQCLPSRATLHAARIGGRPIASILTLRHQQTLVYKYGCSDARFHNLGAMPRLFWQIIQEAKQEHLQEFDLGRSELDNEGLIRFKDHFGATRTTLSYWQSCEARKTGIEWASRHSKNLLSRLPDGFFRLAGELFYRHAG